MGTSTGTSESSGRCSGSNYCYLFFSNLSDELCVSIPNTETAQKVKKIMEKAIRLKIPNKVDYASGDNWGDIK